MVQNLKVLALEDAYVTIGWDAVAGADSYKVYWADKDIATMVYKCMAEVKECEYTLKKASHVPHYLKVAAVVGGKEQECSAVLKTDVKKVFNEQLEKLTRGLIAGKADKGIFLGWRMMLDEVKGYSETGLTGTDFVVYKNGEKLATVTDSTNYLDEAGTMEDVYQVAAIADGVEAEKCEGVKAWTSESNYIEIPMQIPAPDVTPVGEEFHYNVNDMSVGDIDGDGEYEYFVKWDASNAKDVSQKGYTGKCFIDCYKLDGTLLWRLDMGLNIRGGAHYTQFMVYDFDNDGNKDLFVASSWGSGLHRSVISVFNSVSKESTILYDTSTTDTPSTDLIVAQSTANIFTDDPDIDEKLYYSVLSVKINIENNNFANLAYVVTGVEGHIECEDNTPQFIPYQK